MKAMVLFLATLVIMILLATLYWIRRASATAITIPVEECSKLYEAEVLRIIDGDTFMFLISLGLGASIERTTRLLDVDAWEKRGEEKEKGEQAQAFVENVMPVGSRVVLRTDGENGKYGRLLVRVYLADNRDLGKLLLQKGHAKNYDK